MQNTTDQPAARGRLWRAGAWFAAGALGATTLTGVAMANNGTAQTTTVPADAAVESQDGGPRAGGRGFGHAGPGGPGGHHMKGPGGLGPVLHGESVIEDPDGGYRTVVNQRGEVTDVGDASITVRSEDGFEATYGVDGDTRVGKNREQDQKLSDIEVGDVAHVMADGDTEIAGRIGALSADQAAEMQKLREGMREQREQFREQFGDKPGAGGGPGSQEASPTSLL